MSDKLIEAILRYTENAVQFGVEQLPEIAEQYLQLCLINHVGWLIVYMICLIICLYVIRRIYVLRDTTYLDVHIYYIIPGFMSIIFCIGVTYNISNIIAIKYTPKAYLIREILNKQGK
jgi:hypothetical protein